MDQTNATYGIVTLTNPVTPTNPGTTTNPSRTNYDKDIPQIHFGHNMHQGSIGVRGEINPLSNFALTSITIDGVK